MPPTPLQSLGINTDQNTLSFNILESENSLSKAINYINNMCSEESGWFGILHSNQADLPSAAGFTPKGLVLLRIAGWLLILLAAGAWMLALISEEFLLNFPHKVTFLSNDLADASLHLLHHSFET